MARGLRGGSGLNLSEIIGYFIAFLLLNFLGFYHNLQNNSRKIVALMYFKAKFGRMPKFF